MGDLLTAELHLPDPDPMEDEEDFEETLYPPELPDSSKKVVNMVGRLYGPNRLVFWAIEGVAGIKIRVQSSSTSSNPRHISLGDKFSITLCARDTPTRAALRFECAKRDIERLWTVPASKSEGDEIRLRQMRLAKILGGTYDPAEDEIEGKVEEVEEENSIKARYEAELNLPEATGEDKVTLSASLPLPTNDSSVNWAGRVIGPKGRTLKNLRMKTGCRVEVKGKGVNRGNQDEALHIAISAIDEPERATVRLMKCVAEAKKLLVKPADGEDDLIAKEQNEEIARSFSEKKEDRKKEYTKITEFLAKAKESAHFNASAAAPPPPPPALSSGPSKYGGFDGLLGQPPAASFGASPSPLMNSVSGSLRQSSPLDVPGGGPIRNQGHGKGHRFNPVSTHPSTAGGGAASSMFGGGSGGGLMSGGGGYMGMSMGGSANVIGAGDGEEPVVFVYNIGSTVTEIDLYGLCGPYGAIQKVVIGRKQDGASRGFAFVTFASFEDGGRAVAALDGHPWDKNGFKPLSVSFKKAKEEKSGGGGGGAASAKPKSLLQSPTPSLMGSGGGGFSAFSAAYSMPSGAGAPSYSYSSSYPGMDYEQNPSATGDFDVFIYNVGTEANELDLYSLCSPCGPVAKVSLAKEKGTQANKGFAFVTFKDYDSALSAIQTLNGQPFQKNQGKKLQVSFKTDKKSK